ncbi:MAG TPA: hypothetical protein ENH52_02965 [Nitrospirae bacterium]|nr:hypothetical protein [Nitrospirota bacterium]
MFIMDNPFTFPVSDFFKFAFMQRALLAAVLTGTLCSVIGVFVVVQPTFRTHEQAEFGI